MHHENVIRKKAITSVDFEAAFHVNRKQLKNGQKIYIFESAGLCKSSYVHWKKLILFIVKRRIVSEKVLIYVKFWYIWLYIELLGNISKTTLKEGQNS